MVPMTPDSCDRCVRRMSCKDHYDPVRRVRRDYAGKDAYVPAAMVGRRFSSALGAGPNTNDGILVCEAFGVLQGLLMRSLDTKEARYVSTRALGRTVYLVELSEEGEKLQKAKKKLRRLPTEEEADKFGIIPFFPAVRNLRDLGLL